MTPKETEVKLAALEKSFEELQGVIRKLSQDSGSNLGVLAKLSDDVNTLKSQVATIQRDLQEKEKRLLTLGKTNY